MSELKFANTKWDARDWSVEQKIQWQLKAFELGYTFCGRLEPIYLCSGFFFLESDSTVTQTNDLKVFQGAEELVLELTDMFPKEVETLEQEVETERSVFTHPRWVTCTTSPLLCSIDITEGKDYKVIDVVSKGGELHQYIVCNDEGVADTYHISHFHKVTPEECTYLPSVEVQEVEEECNGFDNLVYCQPDIPRLDYWYIKLNSLSQEQINCIYESFTADHRWSFGETENILMCQAGNYDGDYVWTNTLERCGIECMHKVSFNDIFKEVC